uniref:NAD(P)-dependent oxidoreductase n=1 Tax=Orrella sp. TaxID=1921583 RepID=UPI0040489616
MRHIVVAKSIHQSGLDLLNQQPKTRITALDKSHHPQLAEHLKTADAVILYFQPLTAQLIEQAPKLSFVSRHGVGYDSVNIASLNKRGIPLAITAQANVVAVAEHTIMLALAVARRINTLDVDVRKGFWQTQFEQPSIELHSRQALIVGAGRIGIEVGKGLEALGMQISVYDTSAQSLIAATQFGWTAYDQLAAGLEQADLVSLHLPLLPTTQGLINPLHMKRGSILINTARGGIVKEDELVQALQQNHIYGAGLDVLAIEPAVRNHPIFALENVVLSPHVAALTDQSIERMALQSAQNVIDFFNGVLDPHVIVNASS